MLQSSGQTRFQGPAGVLEGCWQGEPAAAGGLAVLAHPHPLYGGTMDNLVVLEAAAACGRAGLASFRFNFRGVGQSEGSHDAGRGEVDDLEAAVTLALDSVELEPGTERPLILVGYSFGAAMVLRSLAERCTGVLAAQRAILLAPPVTHYDFSGAAGAGVPLGVICGSADQLTPATAIAECSDSWLGEQAMRSVGPPDTPGVVWIEGAGHDLGASGAADTPLAAALDSFLVDLALSP